MPDPMSEFKDAVQRAITRELDRYESRRGEPLGSQAGGTNNAFGALSGPEVPAEFATGYASGETTTAFMFDLSLFDGEDVLL